MSTELRDFNRWFAAQRAASRGRLVLAASVLSLGIVAAFVIGYYLGHHGGDEPRIWSTGPTIEQIQSLGQLVSTRVTISDILTGEADDVRGVWLIKGDALLGIDLTSPTVEVEDRDKHRAVIHLDEPTVLSARVDHERSMTWDVRRTSWLPWRGDTDRLRDRAMYHAQRLVEHAAGQPDIVKEAKRNAERALADVYRAVDWHVEIRWK
jgi:hypothetical protein